jgi:NAD(P)-dependent dehydrogenase (short-subunit alcohol dehydrogenase family)
MTTPVAIITASSQGMGAGIARELATRGYRVSLLARSEPVVALAKELGGTAIQGSVQVADDIERLIAHTMQAYGRVDAVVNNTGHPAKGDPLSISDSDWQAGYELILASVVRMARHVTPIMQNQGGGSIVNISSYAATAPDPARPVSSVFRAALSAWTRVYAEYAAPLGIRVNSILPGYIATRPQAAPAVDAIPLGRYGRTQEIGRTVAFLLSEDASYITGQNLLVDGGMVRVR